MTEFIAPPCAEQISILYQDEHLLLINKPSGLLSLSGKNPLNKDSVHYRLVQDFPTATLVHRLDFGTSGIMLVALNKTINGQLTKQFQDKTINKRYHAVLHGHLSDELQSLGAINAAIAKDLDNFPYMKICSDTGKQALTEFEVIEESFVNANANANVGASINVYANISVNVNAEKSEQKVPVTRVKFTPITGRTHQLRIHSQHIGHPILGCDLYRNAISETLASRLLLHASYLSFTHPVIGIRFEIDCDIPF
ncbi:RNA pseudouridine synthase [Shewanella sp. 10N.286.51.B7]|uniref:RluA family pseudouridine synthase n=1 Tax=Shewanella sp. 10N.286.51.B7 TaxID=1880836 RepID=UPI000C8418D7|nr:pseudouridine synthase [Shewanella sp. 10N.286.51.B7]PMG77051.1 RNA pseudouridine synthase [Shewanella sp. 10N.286.51.B7]